MGICNHCVSFQTDCNNCKPVEPRYSVELLPTGLITVRVKDRCVKIRNLKNVMFAVRVLEDIQDINNSKASPKKKTFYVFED